jgi:hypothetical protein
MTIDRKKVRNYETTVRRYEDEKVRLAGGIRQEESTWARWASTFCIFAAGINVFLAITAFINFADHYQTMAIAVSGILILNALFAFAMHKVCGLVANLGWQFTTINSKIDRLEREHRSK